MWFNFRNFHYCVHNRIDLLDEPTDLDQFLFGSERASLSRWSSDLRDLLHAKCFYCDGEVPLKQGHIDHFVPWARYPLDLAHNFVLAHSRCNAAKAQHVAAIEHLEHWTTRNNECAAVLADKFSRWPVPCDLDASNGIARWVYRQTEEVRGLTWVRGKEFRSIRLR